MSFVRSFRRSPISFSAPSDNMYHQIQSGDGGSASGQRSALLEVRWRTSGFGMRKRVGGTAARAGLVRVTVVMAIIILGHSRLSCECSPTETMTADLLVLQ